MTYNKFSTINAESKFEITLFDRKGNFIDRYEVDYTKTKDENFLMHINLRNKKTQINYVTLSPSKKLEVCVQLKEGL